MCTHPQRHAYHIIVTYYVFHLGKEDEDKRAFCASVLPCLRSRKRWLARVAWGVYLTTTPTAPLQTWCDTPTWWRCHWVGDGIFPLPLPRYIPEMTLEPFCDWASRPWTQDSPAGGLGKVPGQMPQSQCSSLDCKPPQVKASLLSFLTLSFLVCQMGWQSLLQLTGP